MAIIYPDKNDYKKIPNRSGLISCNNKKNNPYFKPGQGIDPITFCRHDASYKMPIKIWYNKYGKSYPAFLCEECYKEIADFYDRMENNNNCGGYQPIKKDGPENKPPKKP